MRRGGGRAFNQLRKMRIQVGLNRYAEGSCLMQLGHTRVLCLASVQEGVPKWKAEGEGGWVTAEYAMLPRATHTRSEREAVKGKISGRTQEISRLIGRSLRAVVDMKKLGPRTIIVDCEVLQADGGTRCASITGGFVALALACRRLKKRKLIEKWPLHQSVAAVSVGRIDGDNRLDLDYEEDSRAQVDMNVVMTGDGKFVELQGTAEHQPFSHAEAGQLMKLAQKGIRELTAQQLKKTKWKIN